MKKLLLFTTLLSTSFASFCPAVALRHAAPAMTPAANAVIPAILAQQPAATPLNTMIAQLLAFSSKSRTKTLPRPA